MIGVSNSAPRLPVLVSVNVPPDSSSGLILLVRVRSARSAIRLARPARFRSPASRMTGTIRPSLGVDGDAQVLGVVVGDRAGLRSIEALTTGCTRSASTAASAKNGRNDSLTPSRGLEVALGPGPQPGDLGDVDLDDGGQLRRDLQRLDHALGDQLRASGTASRCVPRSGLGAAASAAARGCGGRRRLRAAAAAAAASARFGLGRGVQHVLLADAAADAGAGHDAQVDAVLGGELADQRRDVPAVVAVDLPLPPAAAPAPAGAGGGGAACGGCRAPVAAAGLGRGLRLRLPLLRAAARAAGVGLGSGRPGSGSARLLAARPRGAARRRRSRPARRRPRRSRPRRPGSPAACRRPATGSRCRPCRWRPRAAARRPRPRRRPA